MAQRAPIQGALLTGHGGIVMSYPNDGKDWDTKTVLADSTYSLVDPYGEVVADGNEYRNMVRYSDFVGERTCKNTRFLIANTCIDEYSSVDSSMHRAFSLCENKKESYYRMIGQKRCYTGSAAPAVSTVVDDQISNTGLTNTGVAKTSYTPDEYMTDNFPENSYNSYLADKKPQNNRSEYGVVCSQKTEYEYGPQIPKYQQPELSLWIPQKFWFNKDLSQSLPATALSGAQVMFNIQTCPPDELVTEVCGLYVKQEIETATSKTVTYRPWFTAGVMVYPTVKDNYLYINHLFLDYGMPEIWKKSAKEYLIRLHVSEKLTLQSEHGTVRPSKMKHLVEYIFLGAQPIWNTNTTKNQNHCEDWCVYGRVFRGHVGEKKKYFDGQRLVNEGMIIPTTYQIIKEPLDCFSLLVNTIRVRDNTPHSFSSAYMPYITADFVAPRDPGLFMIKFCAYPFLWQPSGHFNFTRGREIVLEWKSRYITESTKSYLYMSGCAMNFLIVAGGTGALKYTI